MRRLAQHSARVAVNARLVQVGLEVFPVYGDEDAGFSILEEDLSPRNAGVRYPTLDELYFALVNMNVSPEGLA